MNRVLSAALVAATMAGVSSAHAAFICDNPAQIIGKVGTNPVISTRVGRNETTHAWYVWHRLANGTIIDRANQYNMTDNTDSDSFRWTGRLNKNPDLWMQGTILPRAGGHVLYVESLRDSVHGNKLVMHSEADCAPEEATAAPATPAAPQYVAPAPQTPYIAPPQHADRTTVPLTTPDNWFSQFTTISVNNKWIKVQVDTGAYGMTMTQSLADAMVNNGDASRGEDSQIKGYDGASQNVHHITIHTLTFGGRDIADVDAVVVPDSGNPLLGMDILRRFGKFTIDTAASQLILG